MKKRRRRQMAELVRSSSSNTSSSEKWTPEISRCSRLYSVLPRVCGRSSSRIIDRSYYAPQQGERKHWHECSTRVPARGCERHYKCTSTTTTDNVELFPSNFNLIALGRANSTIALATTTTTTSYCVGVCGNVRSIRTSRAYKRNSSFVFRVRMKFRCYFDDSARERERESFFIERIIGRQPLALFEINDFTHILFNYSLVSSIREQLALVIVDCCRIVVPQLAAICAVSNASIAGIQIRCKLGATLHRRLARVHVCALGVMSSRHRIIIIATSLGPVSRAPSLESSLRRHKRAFELARRAICVAHGQQTSASASFTRIKLLNCAKSGCESGYASSVTLCTVLQLESERERERNQIEVYSSADSEFRRRIAAAVDRELRESERNGYAIWHLSFEACKKRQELAEDGAHVINLDPGHRCRLHRVESVFVGS
ncbi:unnamed protein product, partial [Trichogramma brassicae]